MLKSMSSELDIKIKNPLETILERIKVCFDSSDCCDDALQAFQLGDREVLAKELTQKTDFTHKVRAGELARTPCCAKHGHMVIEDFKDQVTHADDGERYLGKPILVQIDISELDESEKNAFALRYENYLGLMEEKSILKTVILS